MTENTGSDEKACGHKTLDRGCIVCLPGENDAVRALAGECAEENRQLVERTARAEAAVAVVASALDGTYRIKERWDGYDNETKQLYCSGCGAFQYQGHFKDCMRELSLNALANLDASVTSYLEQRERERGALQRISDRMRGVAQRTEQTGAERFAQEVADAALGKGE